MSYLFNAVIEEDQGCEIGLFRYICGGRVMRMPLRKIIPEETYGEAVRTMMKIVDKLERSDSVEVRDRTLTRIETDKPSVRN